MIKDDIIRLAREAGFGFNAASSPAIERFAQKIISFERNAIMEICNRHRDPIAGVIHHAIRTRGQE